MKSKLILILMLIAVFGFGFKSCKKINPANEPLLTVYSDVQQRSPNGVLIASQRGVSDDLKVAADETLATLFADARARGYQNNLDYALYTIYVLPNCVMSPESHTRGFLIRADSYDGSVYDQDPRPGIGKIYAAEMVIANPGYGGGEVTNQYVICDAPAVDQEMRNAMRYGPEHIILKRNDEAEFQRTWYHGNGIGHPIIPSANNDSSDHLRVAGSRDVVDLFGQIKIAK